jgi:Putative ATP-dependent DNA helicase recG C-terminal
VARSLSVASTSDGRYFLRLADVSKPVLGDEVMRLAAERSALPWETMRPPGVPRHAADPAKLAALVADLRASDRVKPSVKEKSDDELLDHYLLAQGGDLYINLHPDRLEIVNPGPLPMGVTPGNVLHASVRRNEHLARLCHDLKLMEREGSGFDAIYDVLLSQGRPVPRVEEGADWVCVTIARTGAGGLGAIPTFRFP